MRWGEFHYGVDLACAYGTPIMAAADGTVVLAEFYGGFGNCIMIDHGGGIQTIYGHASKRSRPTWAITSRPATS